MWNYSEVGQAVLLQGGRWYIHLEMEQNKFLQGCKNLHIISLVIG